MGGEMETFEKMIRLVSKVLDAVMKAIEEWIK